MRQGETPPIREPVEQMAQCHRASCLGEVCERIGYGLEIPDLSDVRKSYGERHLSTRHTKRAGRCVSVGVEWESTQTSERIVHTPIRSALPKSSQIRGIANRAAAKERAGAEKASEHCLAGRYAWKRLCEVSLQSRLESTGRFHPI